MKTSCWGLRMAVALRENEWTGSHRGRKFAGMGYFSQKEKASVEMAGKKELRPPWPGLLIGDLWFPACCQELDMSHQADSPGMWRNLRDHGDKSPQCARCQLAGNYFHHCLLSELEVPWFMKSTPATGAECAGLRPSSPQGALWEAWGEVHTHLVCCRNVWGSSGLADILKKVEGGRHTFGCTAIINNRVHIIGVCRE